MSTKISKSTSKSSSSSSSSSSSNSSTFTFAAPESPHYLLHFWLDLLSDLKKGILALSDPFFNPPGTGVLHVGQNGLEISVNGSNDTLGLFQLRFTSSKIRGFVCREEIVKMVDLNQVFEVLKDADDSRPVNVFVCGHNSELLFCFPYAIGDHPAMEVLNVPMANDTSTHPKRFPEVSYGLEAIIPRAAFDSILNKIILSEKQPTSVTIDMDAKMSLQVEKNSLETDVSDRHMWFQWTNWFALLRATEMVVKFGIWIVTEPKPHITFRFNLGSLGDLVFLKSADLVFGKDELRHLGTFRSLFSQDNN